MIGKFNNPYICHYSKCILSFPNKTKPVRNLNKIDGYGLFDQHQ